VILAGQSWLIAPETVAVLDALETFGGTDCARFVGGCVRNTLMGQAVDDIDIATTLQPPDVIRALEGARLKAVPTGLAHGTITAVAAGRPFEITTLRRDVSTDGRRASVAFTHDWAEDAARRDFRLNALYARRDGQVVDPTGHGLDDAAQGRVIFVGDPETRIAEDYLRILRFFRFFAWYGRGEPDATAVAACAAMRGGLAQLSPERVSRELLKLLAAPDPRRSLRAMNDAGVLGAVLADLGDLTLFEAVVPLSDDAVVRLAALLPADPARVDATARGLRLSNAMRARLVAAADRLDADVTPARVRAAIYQDGRQAVTDRLLLARAADAGLDPGPFLEIVADWQPPRLPIGGREVAAAGIAPGPATGRVLKTFERLWLAEDFPEDGHEQRLARAIQLAA